MSRAIFNNRSGELIAIVHVSSYRFDMYKEMCNVNTVVGADKWYWKFITEAEFGTYQAFGITEIKPQFVRDQDIGDVLSDDTQCKTFECT